MFISEIIEKPEFTKSDIVQLLSASGEDEKLLFKHADYIKEKYIGNTVYLRGLIEMSNVCVKDCLYCGIRKSNSHVNRYLLNEKEVMTAIEFAYKNRYGSVAIQSGEVDSPVFTD